MGTNVKPRPCLAACGRSVTGRARLCDECVSLCECGRRKNPDRPRCRGCAAKVAAATKQAGGRSNMIGWRKNSRGIYVAR